MAMLCASASSLASEREVISGLTFYLGAEAVSFGAGGLQNRINRCDVFGFDRCDGGRVLGIRAAAEETLHPRSVAARIHMPL